MRIPSALILSGVAGLAKRLCGCRVVIHESESATADLNTILTVDARLILSGDKVAEDTYVRARAIDHDPAFLVISDGVVGNGAGV